MEKGFKIELFENMGSNILVLRKFVRAGAIDCDR
jgi:hypothetical protein